MTYRLGPSGDGGRSAMTHIDTTSLLRKGKHDRSLTNEFRVIQVWDGEESQMTDMRVRPIRTMFATLEAAQEIADYWLQQNRQANGGKVGDLSYRIERRKVTPWEGVEVRS